MPSISLGMLEDVFFLFLSSVYEGTLLPRDWQDFLLTEHKAACSLSHVYVARKRNRSKQNPEALSEGKVELFLIYLLFFVNHLYLDITILNYHLLCGYLAPHPLRASTAIGS